VAESAILQDENVHLLHDEQTTVPSAGDVVRAEPLVHGHRCEAYLSTLAYERHRRVASGFATLTVVSATPAMSETNWPTGSFGAATRALSP